MNYFDKFENVVIFMISNNEFHLIFLRLVEIVFDDDEHVMFFFVIEISFTHDQKLNVARVLFSWSLHQRDQQVVKLIDQSRSFFDFVFVKTLISLSKNSLVDQMIEQSRECIHRSMISNVMNEIMFNVFSNEIVS